MQLSTAEFNARNEIFARLQTGKLTVDAAEAEAIALGLEPLNQIPDKNADDPLRKSRWSLPIVIVWMMDRDPAEVTEFDNAYRAKCRCWRWRKLKLPPNAVGKNESRVREGWHLEPRRLVTTDQLDRPARP